MGQRYLLLVLGLVATAGLLLAIFVESAIFAAVPPIIMLAVLYGGFRVVIGPLPRLIGRIGLSIRWKVLGAVAIMGAVSILAAVVNIMAMDYMHEELHQIQELPPFQVRPAVDSLEDTQHGAFFSFMPLFSVLAALMAMGLGVAIALSVVNPVRRMGQAMRRIASGDFTQSADVDNRDELGELGSRINHTAQELARLQEAAVADERARALRDRITHVTLAQEEERRRISRELHDGLGPSLAAIGNRLRACQVLIRTDPQRAEQELEEIAKSLKGQIQEVRHLIYDLRPLALDQLGLIGAIQQQVERFSQETGIEATFSTSGEVALDSLAEATVLRVVQECLSNVQKHAGASQVEVRLEVVDTGLEVKVDDNGRGFDPGDVASSAAAEGVGLLSMRERAELLAGSLSLQSGPQGGCEVILHIPSKEVDVGVHSRSAS